MLKCNKKQKIYVVCPANNKTGGLELLHQLVFSINNFGLNAYITYTNLTNQDPTNPAFRDYVKQYRKFDEIEDISENIVVIPEIQVELMDRIKNAKVVIWWLSVDNYLKAYTPEFACKLLGFKGGVWYVKHRRWQYAVNKINNRIEYNLAQSNYAIDFLKKNKFKNIYFLSDYINTDYLNIQLNNESRRNVVLYNPKKGIKFSKYLMSLDRSIEWIPLINLTNNQVKNLLLTSKVYVDFGNHPGKDRFPREAAYCGCCIITGKKGAAKFSGDVPIDDKYKFEDKKENGELIIQRIKECFEYFSSCQMEFSEYREMIGEEHQKFNEDVYKIFLE